VIPLKERESASKDEYLKSLFIQVKIVYYNRRLDGCRIPYPRNRDMLKYLAGQIKKMCDNSVKIRALSTQF